MLDFSEYQYGKIFLFFFRVIYVVSFILFGFFGAWYIVSCIGVVFGGGGLKDGRKELEGCDRLGPCWSLGVFVPLDLLLSTV